jgi:methyl-accepting chemotaxis protein
VAARRKRSQQTRAQREFVSEAEEILERLRNDMLELESQRSDGDDQVDPDLVNRAFRSAHSLKGLAGMVGYDAMGALAHRLEDVLDDVRMGRLGVDSPALGVVDRAITLCTELLVVPGDSGSAEAALVAEMIAQLDAALASDRDVAVEPELDIDPNMLRALTEYEEHRLQENVRKGRHLSLVDTNFDIASFEEGLAELSDTAGVLSERIDEVSASIEQMVRSVKQVGTTTHGLSEAASDTSSSMEEMASAMRAIDTTAARTAVLASDVVESSESGLAKVRETIHGMQSIRDATDDAEHVIRGLGERTKEIGAILDVIDDVGDETTLLALNAAIIAAQAGEHGRAFSVVADEIKELADRVLSSTKKISTLIRSVQSEADNAVGAIEAGSQRVSEGVDLAAEAGVSLEGITRAAAESGQHIQRIVEAVGEQTGAAAHVAQLMDSVGSGVDEIRSAGADQDRANEVVYRSAVTIREIAQQVRRTTEEQSRGFSRIRESVESVRESVERMDGSLRDQATACEQVTGFLEMVDENTHSNEQSVHRVESAMEGLSREAEALRAEVGHFEV